MMDGVDLLIFDRSCRPEKLPDVKMVFGAALLSTQHDKVWIKGKVEQYKGRSSALHNTPVL